LQQGEYFQLSGDAVLAAAKFRIIAVLLEGTPSIRALLHAIDPWLEDLTLSFVRGPSQQAKMVR
jgi:hypothetical protein